jgi:hypothetical protein
VELPGAGAELDLVAWSIVAAVGLSVAVLLILARRRAWNADGSDDERRLRRKS